MLPGLHVFQVVVPQSMAGKCHAGNLGHMVSDIWGKPGEDPSKM